MIALARQMCLAVKSVLEAIDPQLPTIAALPTPATVADPSKFPGGQSMAVTIRKGPIITKNALGLQGLNVLLTAAGIGGESARGRKADYDASIYLAIVCPVDRVADSDDEVNGDQCDALLDFEQQILDRLLCGLVYQVDGSSRSASLASVPVEDVFNQQNMMQHAVFTALFELQFKSLSS